jgi:predicted nucleic acid-binding protein
MLLDTNLISLYIAPRARENSPHTVKFIDEAAESENLHVSYVTIYELRRGLIKLGYNDSGDRQREARKKRVQLDKLFMKIRPLGLDPKGWDVAAEIWARGKVHAPAINFKAEDLLIAATALWHDVPLATAELKPAMAKGLEVVAPELELRIIREDP